MSYNTIFLDMGYTLAYPYPSWTDIYHKAYHEAGLAIERETVHETVEAVWQSIMAQNETMNVEATREADVRRTWEIENEILERLGIADNRETIIQQVVAHFRDPANYRVFPEVPDTLSALRDQGHTLAIVSNWEWHLPALCDSLGLTPYFDAIVVSARVGRSKPHPKIFRTALSETDAEPARTLHVGDSYDADIVGARRMGITGILIDRDGATETDHHPTIGRLDEILSLLGAP